MITPVLRSVGRWRCPSYLLRKIGPVLGKQVVEAPLVNVNREHVLVDETSSKTGVRIRVENIGTQLVDELGPERGRNVGRLGRIDILIKLQGPEQDPRVRAREGHDAVPIEGPLARKD